MRLLPRQLDPDRLFKRIGRNMHPGIFRLRAANILSQIFGRWVISQDKEPGVFCMLFNDISDNDFKFANACNVE